MNRENRSRASAAKASVIEVIEATATMPQNKSAASGMNVSDFSDDDTALICHMCGQDLTYAGLCDCGRGCA